MVKSRIACGLDVNFEDVDKGTALCQAVHRGQYEIVKTLIENGAIVNRVDSRGKAAIDYCRDKNIRKLLCFLNLLCLILNAPNGSGDSILDLGKLFLLIFLTICWVPFRNQSLMKASMKF